MDYRHPDDPDASGCPAADTLYPSGCGL